MSREKKRKRDQYEEGAGNLFCVNAEEKGEASSLENYDLSNPPKKKKKKKRKKKKKKKLANKEIISHIDLISVFMISFIFHLLPPSKTPASPKKKFPITTRKKKKKKSQKSPKNPTLIIISQISHNPHMSDLLSLNLTPHTPKDPHTFLYEIVPTGSRIKKSINFWKVSKKRG